MENLTSRGREKNPGVWEGESANQKNRVPGRTRWSENATDPPRSSPELLYPNCFMYTVVAQRDKRNMENNVKGACNVWGDNVCKYICRYCCLKKHCANLQGTM